MEAKAFIVAIDFEKEQVECKLFKHSTGEINPIVSCEKYKKNLQSMFPDYTISIVANEEAKLIYSENL